ncbi:dynein regulatory complex subunit 4 [Xyrichtys novacula]|uniref:Dynein regulatory complex subunit 4 n=1 Tax=Xyrichtys novacula TaxID=13765 RepID=A0AAV1EWB9_XYRNO|nr:dynein regulatory complex subunit 4 [Xyrichtys novacula]
MPPKSEKKKTAAKAKPSAVVDGVSTKEMSKDELWEHALRLREELDRVREEKSYFRQERDKSLEAWDISKRDLEETKARVRNKERQREEAMERHRVEIFEHKQKLKHLLSEQHNTIFKLKMDNLTSTSLIQNQHTEAELGLLGDVHSLQADHRERKLMNENRIRELKEKHQVELMKLVKYCDNRNREITMEYLKEVESVAEADRKKFSEEIQRLEEGYKDQVATLMKNQKRELEVAQHQALEKHREQKRMKDELLTLEKEKTRAAKRALAAQQKKKCLEESVQEAQKRLAELKKEKEERKKAGTEALKYMARVKVMKKQIRELDIGNVGLEQACMKVQRECDELRKKQMETILDIQQKSVRRDMILERKMAAMSKLEEEQEAQLSAAMASLNINRAKDYKAAN